MSHTQGPWRIDQGNCGSMLGLMGRDGPVAMLGVAAAIKFEDAALIAAAPDLLAACEFVLSHAGGPPVDMLSRIRAAVARARGEAEVIRERP